MIIVYIILQVSLSVVSHNFGITSQGSFLFINYLIISGLLIIIFYVISSYYTHVSSRIFFLKFIRFEILLTITPYYKVVIFYLTLTIFYLTFVITLGSYFQNYTSILIQLLPNNYYNFLVLLLVILLTIKYQSSFSFLLYLLPLITFYLCTLPFTVTTILLSLLISRYYIVRYLSYHFIIILFSLVALLLNYFGIPNKFFFDNQVLFNNSTLFIHTINTMSLDGLTFNSLIPQIYSNVSVTACRFNSLIISSFTTPSFFD